MAKNKGPAWTKRLPFNGEVYFLKGHYPDSGATRVVSGECRKPMGQANYGIAEQMLIGGTLDLIKKDGDTIWKTGDGNPPEVFDDDYNSLSEKILEHIVTYVAPQFAEMRDTRDCFERYDLRGDDDDDEGDEEEIDPSERATAKPTRGAKASTKSRTDTET